LKPLSWKVHTAKTIPITLDGLSTQPKLKASPSVMGQKPIDRRRCAQLKKGFERV
jgi:hypothetical protein